MAWKMMDGYEMVIGLEVHVELKTKTKIFCACPTTFGAAPNTQCCPVCMGFPGTLPVLNRQVVHYAVRAGLAVWLTEPKCTILAAFRASSGMSSLRSITSALALR